MKRQCIRRRVELVSSVAIAAIAVANTAANAAADADAAFAAALAVAAALTVFCRLLIEPSLEQSVQRLSFSSRPTLSSSLQRS